MVGQAPPYGGSPSETFAPNADEDGHANEMTLIETFIRNPVKVSVGVVLVVLFGVMALMRMPVELTPRVERPQLSVRIRWPGAGPREMETKIIFQLETLFNDVPGMTRMTSESRDSWGMVQMEFSIDTDMTEVLVHITGRLQQLRDYPEDAEEPRIWKSDNATRTVLQFNLISLPPDPQRVAEYQVQFPKLAEKLERVRTAHNPTLALEWLEELTREHDELTPLLPAKVEIAKLGLFAEQTIANRLTRVPGVAQCRVWGGQRVEMQVVFDPYRLAARRLTVSDIRDALRNENRDTPGGDLQDAERHLVVRTIGRYSSPEQVADEIVAMRDGAPVYVRDLAEVRLGHKRGLEGSRHFNSPALWIGATKVPGANLFEVVQGLKEVRDRLNAGILKQRGLYLHQIADETIYVDSALGLVERNILIGGALTVVILLLFLRSAGTTLVVALAIPVSIVGTFLLLGLMGRSLNVISLAGMAFAVGMLVDNAVVVLENIFRHHQNGERSVVAAIRGTQEVWGAALASTLTTLAVFIPILFVREEAGQLFRDIALAISCGVGLSLLVSITVIPTAAARLLRRPRKSRETGASTKGRRHRIDRLAGGFVDRVLVVNGWLQQSVVRRLVVVVAFLGGAFSLSWFLMPSIEYLPRGNRNLISGNLVTPPGYSVEKLLRLGRRFHEDLRPFAEVAPDDPAARDLELPVIADLSYGVWGGNVWLSTRAVDPARAGEFVPYMRKIAEAIPGVDASINQAGLFSGGWNRGSRSIDINIMGPDSARLVRLAERIRDETKERIPGAVVNARPSLDLAAPEIRIVPRKYRAAQMGLTSSELGYNIAALVNGAYATSYFHDGEEIDLTIVCRDNVSIEDDDVPIAVPSGHVVPLSTVADVSAGVGPPQIAHVERERALTLSVNPPDEVALGEAIDRIERDILKPLEERGDLQGLYHFTMSGTADKLHNTWEALRLNLIIVLLITYLLMAALFESWLYPMVIMVSVPLAAVGGLLGLRVMNLFVLQQLDILTMLGFIILIGTVVNNAILIVHQALNHMRFEGLASRPAVLASVRNRVRPIFMTTLTTTLGLFPLVLFPGAGSELYRGVGSVVLGGLIVSTLFTLFLVPSLFTLMLDAKSKLRGLLGAVPDAESTASSPAVADSPAVPSLSPRTEPHGEAAPVRET